MRPRFMHTSDWQLGVTRQFLNADSQARWAEARFEGIRNPGRNAKEEGCEFIVVAGVEKLRAQASGQGTQAEQATDALALLVRLAGRAG